jgi:hypothetical protein
MKRPSADLGEYLELRHKLGFRLRLAGGLLRRFVRFAQTQRAAFITRKLAVQWANQRVVQGKESTSVPSMCDADRG